MLTTEPVGRLLSLPSFLLVPSCLEERELVLTFNSPESLVSFLSLAGCRAEKPIPREEQSVAWRHHSAFPHPGSRDESLHPTVSFPRVSSGQGWKLLPKQTHRGFTPRDRLILQRWIPPRICMGPLGTCWTTSWSTAFSPRGTGKRKGRTPGRESRGSFGTNASVMSSFWTKKSRCLRW